ncbi:similar to Saccharomyces cerevisiae YER170W ADK2 Mitochondrial adenylate kinase, catalyzes the reversible synthesis of GTP and AMP from GDP and ADP, partial (gap in intron) [Geotrichum candidum]|uniref:GTP:AMP phosphotransferase, mitochondrial n=1 Tax=Geotrichum candidum TaxID=1173061 RepID=A0A0J9XED4_GEOCN
MSKVLRPVRLLLLGAPGSGKGTQTGRLLKDFSQISAISSGDLLRQNIRSGSELGKEFESIIQSGRLVPDDKIIHLIKHELAERNWLNSQSSWLLDGFPRTFPQAKALDKDLQEHDAMLNLVVELDVPEEVILDRIENRYVHIPSGRVYNLTFNPPKVPGKDDVTGEPLSKRDDDNAETFRSRIKTYKEQTLPLLEHYDKLGITRSIQGESSDIIYPKLKELLLREFS